MHGPYQGDEQLHLNNMDCEDNFCLSNAQKLHGYSLKEHPLTVSHNFSSLAGLSEPSEKYALQDHRSLPTSELPFIFLSPPIFHHIPLSYVCSFILSLHHLPVPRSLLSTSLVSIPPPPLFSQTFLDHGFLTVLDSLACPVFYFYCL